LLSRRLLALALVTALPAFASGSWRAATSAELAPLIPARAPVIAERIETEATSASGVTDSRGHFLLGVVLITAGYSANGKYADYLLLQAPIRIANATLAPGSYLLGWTRDTKDNDSLLVTISEAATGKPVVQIPATRNESIHRVEQLRIWPAPRGMIQLGRFTFDYTMASSTEK
jgi:hypothetical protein